MHPRDCNLWPARTPVAEDPEGVPFQNGVCVDAFNFEARHWFAARIMSKKEDPHKQVFVHFEGYSGDRDVWLPFNSTCVRVRSDTSVLRALRKEREREKKRRRRNQGASHGTPPSLSDTAPRLTAICRRCSNPYSGPSTGSFVQKFICVFFYSGLVLILIAYSYSHCLPAHSLYMDLGSNKPKLTHVYRPF